MNGTDKSIEKLTEGRDDSDDEEINQIHPPVIHSANCSAQLSMEIAIKELSFQLRNSEYHPLRVNALVVRFRKPSGSILIYSCGKLMISGFKDPEIAKEMGAKLTLVLQKVPVYAGIQLFDFQVQTLVATSFANFCVRIQDIADNHRPYAQYEPDIASAVCYRLLEPQVSCLIFVSGRVLLSGAKTYDDITNAYDMVFPLMKRHRGATIPESLRPPPAQGIPNDGEPEKKKVKTDHS